MGSIQPHPPTLASLAGVLPEDGKFTFGRTLEAARNDIGCHPDLADPEHAKRLCIWLNQWLCRIGAKDTLPPENKRLAVLADADLQAVSSAYGGLCIRPAAISKTGRRRRVSPTAAAKLPYFVRPRVVTAWDMAISIRTGGGRDQAAFLRHLTTCRSWAGSLEAEGRELGLDPSEIGPYLGRPASSVGGHGE